MQTELNESETISALQQKKNSNLEQINWLKSYLERQTEPFAVWLAFGYIWMTPNETFRFLFLFRPTGMADGNERVHNKSNWAEQHKGVMLQSKRYLSIRNQPLAAFKKQTKLTQSPPMPTRIRFQFEQAEECV